MEQAKSIRPYLSDGFRDLANSLKESRIERGDTTSRLSSISRFGNWETMSNISGLGAFGSIFKTKMRATSNPKTAIMSKTLSTAKVSERKLDFKNHS